MTLMASEEGGTRKVTMQNNPTRWSHALERAIHLALLNKKGWEKGRVNEQTEKVMTPQKMSGLC